MSRVLFALLVSCAPPFEQTRKDLRDFRLVAMAAEGAELRALVWSGEGAFHSTAPALTWTIDGTEVTSAPAAPFTVALTVEDAAGNIEEGVLEVQEGASNPVVGGTTRTIADGSASVSLDTDAVTRWKGSSGTFTETGPASVDWVAADAPLAAILGLSLDGLGGVTWTWADVATDASPYVAVGGRLIPAEATVSAGDYLGTLTAADNLAGLTVTDIVAADADGDVVCGLTPFDFDALVDGRCGLDDAVGARVRFTAGVWP